MPTEDLAGWFRYQLQASADGFIWALEELPSARRDVRPPDTAWLGEWTAARHLFHMVTYEEHLALPSVRQWLGAPAPAFDEEAEEQTWGRGQAVEGLVARFRSARAAQIALLPALDARAWEETRPSVWGPMTLRWVVAKTYQHTTDHTSALLQLALFWDVAARRTAAQPG